MTQTKPIIITGITSKVHNRKGQTYGGESSKMNAEIIKGKSIRIWGECWGKEFDKTFRIDEQAEYHSYNFSYFGKIVAITDKSITICNQYGKNKRLDLYTFAWRNHNFTVEKAQAERDNWYD